MTRMITLCRSARAFILSVPPCGNPIRPCQQPRNGWGRGKIVEFRVKYLDEPLQFDSLALIRLVAFLESDFGIRIEDEELIPENFATLRRLGELIASRSTGAKGAE